MEVVIFKDNPSTRELGFLMLVIVDRIWGRGMQIRSKAVDDLDNVDVAEFRYLDQLVDRRGIAPRPHGFIANSDRLCDRTKSKPTFFN